MALLEMNHISKSFSNLEVIKDISLKVDEGEVLAIIGPSGSGKSTMLRCATMLETIDKGEILYMGEKAAHTDEHGKAVYVHHHELRRFRSYCGLVFQQFHLINYLTAVENVMVAQYYHSMPDEKEALAALERVGLKDRAKHLPSQLSGGEQQRVCIARALINSPELILADEPTGNLDEANENIVLGIFRQLHKEGTSLIVVTHDPEVGEEAQRIVRLDHGKITSDRKNEAFKG